MSKFFISICDLIRHFNTIYYSIKLL